MKRLLIVFALAILYSAAIVSAANPHINVTMSEVVFRNTTFAQDFDMIENTTYCIINGTLNISNPGVEPIYDIYLTFWNTGPMLSNFTLDAATKFGNQTRGTPGQRMIIHIPALRSGNYTTFYYNVSCVSAQPPLDIDTTYVNSDHGFHKKVLAGYNWTITQSVTNKNYLQLNMSNINITIDRETVPWNSTEFNFSLLKLLNLGDAVNVLGNGTSLESWWWAPNGGELAYNQSENITFVVQAPYSVPITATYKAITEELFYNVPFLISNLSLETINASSDINFSIQKRISQPADDPESYNVTWEIRPYINTNVNITYDINRVTMWVTEDQNPLNDTGNTQFGNLSINYTGSPMKEINLSTNWGNTSYYWYFNYTDSTNPPIVWIQPEWLITNDYGQILNYSLTINGEDYYMKYIYVIHGYWLEVRKNVTNIGEDSYQIDVLVENIGNGWTPQFTYVTVYDFVPNDFQYYDLTITCPGTQCQNLSVGTPATDFYGTSFRWNIPWKGTLNASLGPKVGPQATGASNYSWNVSYKVNGTGAYRVTELYIVGLDPLKVDGASVSPVIAVITGLQSYTKEIIYIGIVVFLVVINITNLVITNKINRKLDHHKQ